MRTWETIVNEVKQQLDDNLIEYEVTGDVIHTTLCTIEVTGTPYKPEYWVNETRITRLEGIADAVHRCVTTDDDPEAIDQVTGEPPATCGHCGKDYLESEINMTDYPIDLCALCIPIYKAACTPA